MTCLVVLAAVAAGLWLLSSVRLGARGTYREGKFTLLLRIGPGELRLYPPRARSGEKKEKTPKEGAKKKDKPRKPEKKKSPRGRPEIMDLILLAVEAAGELRRKIRIDGLTVHLIWASPDPADTAIGFGRMNAAMGILWGLIENNFKVKDHDIGVSADFDREKPVVECDAALTFTTGQILSYLVVFGVKFLKLWRRSGKTPNQNQEALNHE